MGQNQKFVPLVLDKIGEGQFLAQANKALEQLQAGLLAYRAEHGTAAKGAKALLTVKVRLTCERPEDELFTVAAAVVSSLPDAPPSVTVAMPSETDEGQPALFVRQSGSTADTPRQAVLCTEAGEIVKQEE